MLIFSVTYFLNDPLCIQKLEVQCSDVLTLMSYNVLCQCVLTSKEVIALHSFKYVHVVFCEVRISDHIDCVCDVKTVNEM